MSETSSDTESSCGWTLISNEGSDIESLGLENALEHGTDPPGIPPDVEPAAPVPTDGCCEGKSEPIDGPLKEELFDETMSATEDIGGAACKEHVTLCSSSDLSSSDIVTLGDMKEVEEEEEEPAVNEESYLGTSSSSQYTFTAVETVLPAQQLPGTNSSSSSEDECPGSATTVLRRRRPRRNTSSLQMEPEEELLESGQSEDEEEEEEEEEEARQVEEEANDGRFSARVPPPPGEAICSLKTCILLAVVVVVSMGVGHYYGTLKVKYCPEYRQCGYSEKVHCAGDLFEIEAQSDELVMRLKQVSEDWDDQKHQLTTENLLLKTSLEREEQSLLALQVELRSLHSKITELEDRGSTVDSLVLANQKLKDQLEEKKALTRGVLSQREAAMAETRSLRKELDRERRFTESLREDMEQLASGSAGAEESQAETQTRLAELERKLSFEQQRSDLWERLYVETKEEKAKGDTQPRVKKTKEGVAGKVKETFDAVKNSTKEFVHHHKEQIKKAKEAVKENLRKFSDSVKSTFRHFKDSASTFMNKATGGPSKKFHEQYAEGPWQHRPHKRQHSHASDNTDGFKDSQNTRKSGHKVNEDGDTHDRQASPKGCSGVFDCAFKESMNLFHKGMEPVRADEFHQLLQSYLHQEVDHFQHWKELDKFINNFFHNGVFIHDQMLFKDFVSRVGDYLGNMHEYYGLDDSVFEDLDEYVFRHFYGNTYTKSYGPSRPMDGPDKRTKERLQEKQQQQQQRKQQRARSRPQRERKNSRSGGSSDRHMADVKIELGPMPFDPKY